MIFWKLSFFYLSILKDGCDLFWASLPIYLSFILLTEVSLYYLNVLGSVNELKDFFNKNKNKMVI